MRSDWTELAKDFQQQLYALVFEEKPVADYIRDYVQSVYQGEFTNSYTANACAKTGTLR